MYLFKRGRDLILAQAHLGRQRGKLAVDIAPFAQAALREKILCQLFSQFTVGFFMLDGLVEKSPDFQIAHEIRALILKRLMRAIGGLGAVKRSIARILHG